MSAPVVRLIGERWCCRPRLVEVEHGGRWWPGLRSARRLCDDHRGWLREVEFTVEYERGRWKHLAGVPADRLRLTSAYGAAR
jgi:hypothetical protein